ncbi:MAG: MBOAT family protein [Acidimicrobiia bacterium]|nr:MBOAT family protein [Acidimicrobiia bacterium]
MLFNTLTYAAFLPITLCAVWLSPPRWRNHLLVIASYMFYGAWDVRFLGLLWVSTATDYVIGRRLAEPGTGKSRKRLLLVSVAVNMGILGFFKYFGFFVDSAAAVLTEIGAHPNLPLLAVALPVGISFYTFQTLSYTIDVYRGRTEAEHNLIDFALFVAFFPQLVAGPIERANRLLPQLRNRDRRPTGLQVEEGIYLIIFGLLKKVVIADTMAPIVDQVYREGRLASGAMLLVGVYAFALQIYGDFSGYTDIARGSARLLGVDLMVNFNQPYLAWSITEFWRRWHISLSAWLRDYIYIPLGGNRRGEARTYANLMATMLIGGLWHGAGWTFVVWGGLHGLALAIHRRFRASRPPSGAHRFVLTMSTFHVVALLWVFFRSPDFAMVTTYLSRLGRWAAGPVDSSQAALVAIALILVYALDRFQEETTNQVPVMNLTPTARGAMVGAAAVGLVIFGGGATVPFIYFRF